MALHKTAAIGDIHIVHNAEVDNLIAMKVAAYSSADIGKVIRIPTEGGVDEYYIVKSSSPTFQRIALEHFSEVKTTNANETTLFSITSHTDYTYHVKAVVIGNVTGGGNTAGFERESTFKNDSGTLSIIGTTTPTHTAKDDANWDCQIEADALSIEVNVTGVAATDINWVGWISVYRYTNA